MNKIHELVGIDDAPAKIKLFYYGYYASILTVTALIIKIAI